MKIKNRRYNHYFLKGIVMIVGLSLLSGCAKEKTDTAKIQPDITTVSEIKEEPKESISGTSQAKEQEPTIVLPPPTKDEPYPWPVLDEADFKEEDIGADILDLMVKRLCYDLFLPMKTLEVSDVSSYIADNPSTHLAIRWPELFIREVQNAPWKQVLDFTSLENTQGRIEKQDGIISYYTMCELRYERKEPSVNGCNIDVIMKIEAVEGKWKIVGLELGFDSRYGNLLEGLKKENPEQSITIEEIDEAFEKLLESI